MADESSLTRWHKKQEIPEPERQIGTTPDGKPIFVDLREILTSPDEHLERWDTTLHQRKAAMIDRMANDVLESACKFIELTYLNVIGKAGEKLYREGRSKAAFELAQQNGLEAIQDGLQTIIKVKGKIVRSMTANIDLQWREYVAHRVNQLVRKTPSKI